MALPSTRQACSRPVIPVVPRIFETSHKAPAPSKVAVEDKEVVQPTDTLPTSTTDVAAAAEPTDWASLAAAEDAEENPRSVSGDDEEQAIVQTPKGNGAANGATNGLHYPTDAKTGPVNGHQQYGFGPQRNGHLPVMPARVPATPGYPPGLGPHPPRRAGQHIAFGSFDHKLGSEGSSPTLPPSATSTQFTQPTPLSDSHSQASSRGGHMNGGVDPALHVQHPNQANVGQPKFFEQRSGVVDFVAHAAAAFSDRNRDDLLKAVGQDLYARGAGELVLTVSTKDGRETFRIWRAICRRSPELSRLLDQGEATRSSMDGSNSAEVRSGSSFVTVESVRAIVQSLYGIPLAPPKRPLDVVATGYLLGARVAIEFGTELTVKTLNWESLAASFHFCLEDSKFDYGSGRAPNLVDLSSIIGTFRPHYADILAQSLDCIIREINSDQGFRFDEHAAYFTQLGGGFHARPVSVELRSHGQHPKPNHGHSQSQIQFGNMDGIYRLKHQVLSSLLLSLPLTVLQHVLSHVVNLAIVQDVVQEREKRRVYAIKGTTTTTSPHAHYQESILSTPEFNGMRVVSKKVL